MPTIVQHQQTPVPRGFLLVNYFLDELIGMYIYVLGGEPQARFQYKNFG